MNDHRLTRRDVIEGGLAGLAALMVPSLPACKSGRKATPAAAPGKVAPALSAAAPNGARSNIGSLGELGAPDENGVRLPPGFRSRIVARTGEEPVAGCGYEWHAAPDGGATFVHPDGGWVYVSNSEVAGDGGAGALRFDATGKLVTAYSILRGTSQNCAGGKTPWNTWLSCEEIPKGRVHECDPFGQKPAIVRLALGVFRHEAAAVDPAKNQIYLTEDEVDGCFYRFVPDKLTSAGLPDLTLGRLEAAEVSEDGSVRWHPVPDAGFDKTPTREQVARASHFDGGEGIVHYGGTIFFATKGNDRVWAYDIAEAKIRVHYDRHTAARPILRGVDNLTVSCCGDVLVAEDGGSMQVVALLPDGTPKVLLQIVGHEHSEIAGIAFDPSGTRLYLSSQRGVNGRGPGLTFEVSGPFQLA